MTHADMKRRVGYVQPDFTDTCGTCRRCYRRGCHLRCNKWEFEVNSLGICRNGYEKLDLPLNAEDHPLLVPIESIKEDMMVAYIYGPRLLEYHEEVVHE